MTRSQQKQFRPRFDPHRYPVKTFRGDPTRPAYTLYSLWEYPIYLAAANELDELLEQWPYNQPRTLALLAVRAAFYANGAPHWAEQLVWDENQANIHSLMLSERQQARRLDPERADRHAQHVAQAEATLGESQRRKQGPPTGTATKSQLVNVPKRIVLYNKPSTFSTLSRSDKSPTSRRTRPGRFFTKQGTPKISSSPAFSGC